MTDVFDESCFNVLERILEKLENIEKLLDVKK